VVYINLETGCSELFAMYQQLNSGPCRFSERYCYCPHITLGQNLPQEKVQQTLEAAIAAWKNWPLERSFRVETLSFVQNTTTGRWIDLDQVNLTDLPVPPPLTQTDRVGPAHRV
jgi:2'-5' RNA ligase